MRWAVPGVDAITALRCHDASSQRETNCRAPHDQGSRHHPPAPVRPGRAGRVRFAGGPGTDDLLQAVTILAGLYAIRARKVPDGAPGGFVAARWAGYLEKAAKDGDVTAYRHYWELT